MQMYLIELFFRKKKMYSVTSLIFLVMVAFAALFFLQRLRDFLCRIPSFSQVMLHVACLLGSCVVDSSLEFVAIISFRSSLGKLELQLSSN